MNIIRLILSFVFPPRCALCGEINYSKENKICENCLKNLPLTYSKPAFPMGEKQKGRKKIYFYSVISPFYYIDCVRKGILGLKFYGRMETSAFLGAYMADCVKYNAFYKDIDLIVSVPASRQRKNKRGYNQCLLLAKEIAKILNIELHKDLLIRKKNASPQSLAKNKYERKKNVLNAFTVSNSPVVKGKNILLVDDVVTTGATLNECAKVLKQCGANKVLCVTAAKGKSKN